MRTMLPHKILVLVQLGNDHLEIMKPATTFL